MADKAFQIFFDSEAVDDEFYGDVVSLTVEENTGALNTLQLRLATSLQDDGTWKYLEDNRLAVFARISVKIGFIGGGGLAGALGGLDGGNDELEPVFDGYVTAVDVGLGSEPGSTYVDLSGMDTGVLMTLEEKIVSWPNLSDSDIARQVLAGYVATVQADSSATVHQENDTTYVQRGTDYQVARALARRNGFEFYFETDKASGEVVAYFRAPRLDGTPQADLAIQFGDGSNLRTFSAHLTGPRPLNVKLQQIDVKSNSVNSAQAGDTQLRKLGATDLNALVGDRLNQLVTPRDAPAQMLPLGSPTSDATELQAFAQAVRDEAGWFVTANGEINSDAYQTVLRPHRLVLVKGVGALHSGTYYVTGVTHQLEAGGAYTQKFEARRNAVGVDGSEQFAAGSLGLAVPGLPG